MPLLRIPRHVRVHRVDKTGIVRDWGGFNKNTPGAMWKGRRRRGGNNASLLDKLHGSVSNDSKTVRLQGDGVLIGVLGGGKAVGVACTAVPELWACHD